MDPRIQPVLLTNNINLNNNTEIIKIIFDPSKVPLEDNFMKGELSINTTSKYISYKELYLWKENQKVKFIIILVMGSLKIRRKIRNKDSCQYSN